MNESEYTKQCRDLEDATPPRNEAKPAPVVDAAEVIERLDEISTAMLFGGVRDENYRPTTEAMIDNITRAYVLIDNLKGKCVGICRRAILAEPDCGFTVGRTSEGPKP